MLCDSAHKMTGSCGAQESLEHLETPSILAFCHQLPLLMSLWGLSLHGDVNIQAVSTVDVQAAIPSAVLTGLALIATLASLITGDVLVVVTYMTLADLLANIAAGLYLRGESFQPSPKQQARCSL